jgi:CheY-like chemotaxis protein
MARSPDEIASKIPYLRRYARALTGSQAVGDQYVRISLEMILERPDRLPDKGDLQRELFRLLHDVWTKVSPEGISTRSAGNDARVGDLLGSLGGRERQVLLLVAVEGYAFADAAYILGIDEAKARELFNRAQADMMRQTSAPVLIIEDEKLIAVDLKSIVEGMGHQVCGIAAGESEAIALAAKTKPRLILADIHLKDGDSGIVAVRKILRGLDVPIIFITAYPEELLTGKAPEPAFVITKPFRPETIVAAVSQALFSQAAVDTRRSA